MADIVLGLSGGIDSAVAATKLINEGYSVFGVYCIMHEHGRQGIEAWS